MTVKKKLIEVALPLEAINKAAAHRGLEDRRAGRVAGYFWRRSPPPRLRGNLPLPGRPACLVRDTAHGHEARGRPRRAVEARPGQGGRRARSASSRGPPEDGRLLARASAAANGSGRARRSRRA